MGTNRILFERGGWGVKCTAIFRVPPLTSKTCFDFLAHTDEAPYIDGRKTPVKLAAMLERYDSLPAEAKAWCEKMRAGFANRKIQINKTLSDGEILPVCGGIEVIHTPGHTPGHICLLLKESGVLVGGDAINIADGKIAGPNIQQSYDIELAPQSFEKIKKYPINAVISYHCGYIRIDE